MSRKFEPPNSLQCLIIIGFILAMLIDSIGHSEPKPGDCDQNGQLDISDAVCIINAIFLGITPPRLEWMERDTVATLLVLDGRTYRMRDHNIEYWRHYVVAGNDTGVVEWIKIGESMKMDSSKIVEVR